MPTPATIQTEAERPVTAWTTYEELTADQRERFGAYVSAKDEARRVREACHRADERAAAAMRAAGGDKAAAFKLLLAGL